jgi:hypothetical protein
MSIFTTEGIMTADQNSRQFSFAFTLCYHGEAISIGIGWALLHHSSHHSTGAVQLVGLIPAAS